MKLVQGKEYLIETGKGWVCGNDIGDKVIAHYVGAIRIKSVNPSEAGISVFYNDRLMTYIMFSNENPESYCSEIPDLEVTLEEVAKKFGVESVKIVEK